MDSGQKDIKVSVVVAVYNSEAYLKETLDSIRNQSLRDIEIICVDDGSTDSSLSILKEYAESDTRITVLQQKEKTDGAAAARNLGISHACGEFLAILDSDDFFETDMLEEAYKRAIDTGADIVIYDGYVFDERNHADKEAGFILYPEYLPAGKDVFSPKENANQLFQMTIGAAWNCLIRRKFAEDKNIRFQSFHHADDLGYVYTAFACAEKIAVLNKRLVHYRMNNAGSQAANISKWPETAYKALKQLKGELLSRNCYDTFKASFVQAVMVYSIFYLDNIKDCNAFLKLYQELQERYLRELETFDIPDWEFLNPYWVKIRDFIYHKTATEYLFHKMYKLPPFNREEEWRKKIPEKSKIVIYGAGNVGTEIFCELERKKNYQIKAWVDREYQAIGYPVMAPETIKTIDFEYILIAVATDGLYQSIRKYLLEYGVEEEKII